MSAVTGKQEPSALAEQLEELKQRSGRSYAALAHRTGLSRSTLHRYCQGTTVPGTFGAVERLARVCGADEGELDRLYRAWRRAVAEQEHDQEHDRSTTRSRTTTSTSSSRAPYAGRARVRQEARPGQAQLTPRVSKSPSPHCRYGYGRTRG